MGGMLGGMIAAHFWLGRAWALRIPPPELGMHLAMLAGMLAGMLPAMWVRDALLVRRSSPLARLGALPASSKRPFPRY